MPALSAKFAQRQSQPHMSMNRGRPRPSPWAQYPSQDGFEARQAFCERLKAVRESRGMALATIAQSTKISASYFAALERNDLRKWPKGIFRRAYFRDYVHALGLPVDSMVAEFRDLFPDDPAEKNGELSPKISQGPSALRIAFDGALPWPVGRFTIAAGSDMALVLLVAICVSWWVQVNLWTAATVVALSYYSLGTVAFGRSLGAWVMHRPGATRRNVASSVVLRSEGADADPQPGSAPPDFSVVLEHPSEV